MWETLMEVAKTVRVISESWARTMRALVLVLVIAGAILLVIGGAVWGASTI